MEFDVIVIGAGPGGYVAAIRAAQLGFNTACIEKYPTLGGTCLNVGCIPSKALLHSSELYHEASASFGKHGIAMEGLSLDLGKMMARKRDVVTNLTKGIAHLLKKNKVTALTGTGKLLGQGRVQVTSEKETQEIKGKHIVIATGSKPTQLPFMPFDDDRIVSSTGALAFKEVPDHLLVIGAGVIGLELGSVWRRLGARVTVVEFLDRVLPPMDKAVSKEMKKLLTRQGMKFHLNTGVTSAEVKDWIVHVCARDKKDKELTFEADRVLVAVGRKPNTAELGLENVGIVPDKQGFIGVDAHFSTGAEGVYAIGDVIGGMMLAHKAEDEGIALMEQLAGKAGHLNYDAIPNIVYTWPEVASVGKTEQELEAASIPFKVGQFPFKANARARCMDTGDGFVKIIADETTDRILGVHIVGANASELIAEAVLATEYAASAEDLARTVHGHPTLSESVKEAALAVDGRTIHI